MYMCYDVPRTRHSQQRAYSYSTRKEGAASRYSSTYIVVLYEVHGVGALMAKHRPAVRPAITELHRGLAEGLYVFHIWSHSDHRGLGLQCVFLRGVRLC